MSETTKTILNLWKRGAAVADIVKMTGVNATRIKKTVINSARNFKEKQAFVKRIEGH